MASVKVDTMREKEVEEWRKNSLTQAMNRGGEWYLEKSGSRKILAGS